jgi:hypothetical protein
MGVVAAAELALQAKVGAAQCEGLALAGDL